MPSSNIYLGSNQILEAQGSRRIYLGTQLICKAYLGSNLVYDNCGFVPVTVTLQVTNNISGPSAGYTIGGNTSGSVQSGQAGTQGYSFITTANSNTGYSFSSGPSFSPTQPNAGNYPTVDTTVYTTITGQIQQNQQPTFTDSFTVTKDSSLTQGTVTVVPSSAGPSTTGTPYTTEFKYTGASSGYNYPLVQISIGGASAVNMTNPNGDGYTWVYTYNNTIGSSNRNIAALISGTEQQQTTSRTITFDRDITGFGYQYASTSYSITGTFNVTAGSASGTLNSAANSASVTIEAPANTNINISFSSVSDGGYDFRTSTNGTNCTDTTGVAYSSDAPGATTIGAISSNQTYNVVGCLRAVADTSYGYGPYLSLSSACSDRNSGQYGNSAEYNYYNGDEGVLPSSGVIGQAWSINNGITQELTNYRWYVTEDEQDSNGNNIVFYYFNGIQSATCP